MKSHKKYNKLGEWDLKTLILGLMLAGVLLVVVFTIGKLAAQTSMLYPKANISYSGDSNFTVGNISVNKIDSATGTVIGCSKLTELSTGPYMTCSKGTTLSFMVQIFDAGINDMRIYYGATIICKENDKSCSMSLSSKSPERCVVARGETQNCDAGTFTFDNSGTFIIYPAAECILDSKYGCYYSQNLPRTETAKNYNQDKKITVKIS